MKRLTNRMFAALLMLWLSVFAVPVWANAQAENLVTTINSRIFTILQQRHAELKANPDSISSFVQQEIIPFVDFEGMTKLTLGKHWKTASPLQRQRFSQAYKAMLIRSYANTMLGFAGAKIRVIRSVPSSRPGYISVESEVQPVTSATKKAKFDLRFLNNTWKAYNVSVDGVDLITNFRTNFTREISESGLDALITRLESTVS